MGLRSPYSTTVSNTDCALTGKTFPTRGRFFDDPVPGKGQINAPPGIAP